VTGWRVSGTSRYNLSLLGLYKDRLGFRTKPNLRWISVCHLSPSPHGIDLDSTSWRITTVSFIVLLPNFRPHSTDELLRLGPPVSTSLLEISEHGFNWLFGLVADWCFSQLVVIWHVRDAILYVYHHMFGFYFLTLRKLCISVVVTKTQSGSRQ